MSYFAAAFVAILLLEAALAAAIHWLKRDCPWLITKGDLKPKIDRCGLARFISHGWDPDLGWIRKPNTSHPESGGTNRQTTYSIDHTGARTDPGMEDLDFGGVAYGDSYTFCRQVNDDQTWPHMLSRAMGQRLANCGVGNYGLDQALLRYEREASLRGSRIAIMGVVPETICRVQSVWKHFSEYGNIFAFKPRYRVTGDGELAFVPNAIRTEDDFYRIDELLPELIKNDAFYAAKFQRDMLRVPYVVHVARTWKRTLPLVLAAAADRFSEGGERAFFEVMKRNTAIAAGQYQNEHATTLLAAIVRRFAETARSNGAVPILVIIPQLLDLQYLKNGNHFYLDFLDSLEGVLNTVDLGPTLLEQEDDTVMYIEDKFGGHLSPEGNRIVCDALFPLVSDILDRPVAGIEEI